MSQSSRARRRTAAGGGGGTAATAAADKLSEVDKEYLAIQMRTLEQKNAQLVDQMRTLQQRNLEYVDKYNALLEDQTDVVSYLERMLSKRSSDVLELQERLSGLEVSMRKEKDAASKESDGLRHEMRRTKERLEGENKVLTQKLDALEEFRLQREQLTSKSEEQQREMVRQRESYEAKLQQMEKQHIIDEAGLKEEMTRRLESVEAEYQASFASRMSKTTQRALKENLELNERLQTLTHKLAEVMKEQERAEKRVRASERKYKLINDDLARMTRVALSRCEVIRELVSSCDELRRQLSHAHSFVGDRRRYEDRINVLELSLADLSSKDEERVRREREQEQEVVHVQKQLHDDHEKHRLRDEALQQAYLSIFNALALKSDSESALEDVESVREGVLQQLLTLLNVADGPCSKPQEKELMRLDTCDYEQGSLGLVPSEEV